jgi:D-galactarolactone cycloisomerase
MTITSIEALVIRVPGTSGCGGTRAQQGTAGARSEQALETVLARVTADSGAVGWGESRAFSAPQVTGAIIQSILKPALEGKEFGGSGIEIETLWNAMFNQMRLSGQTGGFMLDAMAAVDIALWDLAGKINRAPISKLIAGSRARTELETYVNRLWGDTVAQRMECAQTHFDAGCSRFKIHHESSRCELFENYDALAKICGSENIAVDALWKLDPAKSASFVAEMDRRKSLWLESPFAPEDPAPHAAMVARCRTPIALGETYRTHFELAPFFRAHAMKIVQPDLGRCGITESLRIARAAERAGLEIVPHLTAALGPLLLATLQFAAAVPNCRFTPYSTRLLETVNAFAAEPVGFANARYNVPAGPGLGVELAEPEVRQLAA